MSTLSSGPVSSVCSMLGEGGISTFVICVCCAGLFFKSYIGFPTVFLPQQVYSMREMDTQRLLINSLKALAVGIFMYGIMYMRRSYLYSLKEETTVPELLERIRCKQKMFTNDSKAVEEAQLKSLHEYAFHSLKLEDEATTSEAIARVLLASEYAEKNLRIGSISLTHLRGIHGNMFKDDREKSYMAGQLRNEDVEVAGVDDGVKYNPPSYVEVENWLEELLNNQKVTSDSDLILVAAKTKLKFLLIHPFLDGNGRVSRVLFNALLRRARYPWVVFPSSEKYRYFKSMNVAEKEGNGESYLRYVSTCVERSLDYFI